LLNAEYRIYGLIRCHSKININVFVGDNTICVKLDLLGLLQRRVLCERPCGDGNVFVGDNTTKAKRCEKGQWHCSNRELIAVSRVSHLCHLLLIFDGFNG